MLHLGRPRWDGTRRNIHSLTACPCQHYTTSFINFLHFLPSIASSMHIGRVWQYFSMTSLQGFFGLPLGLTPYASKSMHFFTQSFSAFLKTCPYHLNLCPCITVIISSLPSLSPKSLLENLSVILMPHIHLIILISARWSVNFYNFLGRNSTLCHLPNQQCQSTEENRKHWPQPVASPHPFFIQYQIPERGSTGPFMLVTQCQCFACLLPF